MDMSTALKNVVCGRFILFGHANTNALQKLLRGLDKNNGATFEYFKNNVYRLPLLTPNSVIYGSPVNSLTLLCMML